MFWTWLACTADRLEAELLPSEWIPAAATVRWDGPAGHAVLFADDGPFSARRIVAEADVEDGVSELSLALLPPGRWRWRIEVEDGPRRWTSGDQPFDVPDPPAQIADLAVDVPSAAESQLAAGGFWVGYAFGFRWHPEDAVPFVIDGRGDVVWWAPPDPDGGLAMRVRPAADGRSIYVLEDFEDPDRRVLHRYALDGSSRTDTPVPRASHDFWPEDDGTVTWIAYVTRDDEAIPGVSRPVVADRLRTVPEGGSADEIVDGFDFFDDYPADPWYPCSHAESFVPGAVEWSHTNSILRSPVGEGFVLVARYLDALVAVDGHALLWQAGGRESTLSTTDPEAAFEHAHASHTWLGEDGRIRVLVFDNGNHSPEPIVSRVVELAIDPRAGTYEAVWDLPDPDGALTNFLGDARRLPDGNTLITWSAGRMVEYGPEGDVVWRLDAEGPLGRGFWVPDLRP